MPHTLPRNYTATMENYAHKGYRIIALGMKDLPGMNYVRSQKVQREEIECDLTFLGFLVMENKLKPATTGIIQTLNRADIRTIMATGDNQLTGVSVGRECHIIPEDVEVFLADLRCDDG